MFPFTIKSVAHMFEKTTISINWWSLFKYFLKIEEFNIKLNPTCPAVSTSWRLKSWPFTDTILLNAIRKWTTYLQIHNISGHIRFVRSAFAVSDTTHVVSHASETINKRILTVFDGGIIGIYELSFHKLNCKRRFPWRKNAG